MKKLLMIAAGILIAGVVLADPQGGGTITGSAHRGPTPAQSSRDKALHPGPVTNGVIGRAFQPGGNPLQMLNPKAPAQYGNAATSLAIDPDTGKWAGIKLIEFLF